VPRYPPRTSEDTSHQRQDTYPYQSLLMPTQRLLDILGHGVRHGHGIGLVDIDGVVVPAITVLRVPPLDEHRVARLAHNRRVVDVNGVALYDFLHQRVCPLLNHRHILDGLARAHQ